MYFQTVKDKASVLVEVAKLQEIRDELTTEVASLHALLEQERSKTRASSADPKTTKQTVRLFLKIIFKKFGSFLDRSWLKEPDISFILN